MAAPALAAPAAMGQAPEPELSVYLTLASDSVQRGLSQSDSGPAIQGGLDYAHPSGAFAGLAVATVDYAADARLAGSRDTAVDYYLGYTQRNADWTWAVALAHYDYPGVPLDYDYDYDELNVSVTFRQRWSYSVAATDDLLSFGASAVDHELAASWPLPGRLELGAAVGRFDVDGLAGGGYDYWNIGVSRLVQRFAVDLRYYDTAGATPSYLGAPADGSWVLSASYGLRLTGAAAP